MTSVEMRDKLQNALDKLSVIFSICASDADINSCHDGLSLLADNVFVDVAEVLEALDERTAAESRQKDSDTKDDTEDSTDGFTMAQIVAVARELGVHYEDMFNAISKVGEASA